MDYSSEMGGAKTAQPMPTLAERVKGLEDGRQQHAQTDSLLEERIENLETSVKRLLRETALDEPRAAGY